MRLNPPDGVIKGLVRSDGTPITSMGASWTSMAYELGDATLLATHLFWSDPTITGVLYIEYSGVPIEDVRAGIEKWDVFNAINLDGTFDSAQTYDHNLAINTFRLRYVRATGTASLNSYVTIKRV